MFRSVGACVGVGWADRRGCRSRLLPWGWGAGLYDHDKGRDQDGSGMLRLGGAFVGDLWIKKRRGLGRPRPGKFEARAKRGEVGQHRCGQIVQPDAAGSGWHFQTFHFAAKRKPFNSDKLNEFMHCLRPCAFASLRATCGACSPASSGSAGLNCDSAKVPLQTIASPDPPGRCAPRRIQRGMGWPGGVSWRLIMPGLFYPHRQVGHQVLLAE